MFRNTLQPKEIFNFLFLINFGFHAKCNVVAADDLRNSNTHIKIGIIGGGIGGTAAAYFLRNAFKNDALLHIYEPNKIGGRLSTSLKFDKEYETGGSIIHPQNQYMNEFVEKFGMLQNNGCSAKYGIFNGKDFLFLESDWSFVNIIKAFWRYGLDIYKLNKFTNKMLRSFSNIYDNQFMGKSYKTVEDLLESMDVNFPSLLKKSFRSYLKELNFHDLIINEIVTACIRANYGQMANIHAFVGSVSVAGANPDLWSVAGGNKRVPEELAKRSEAVIIPRFVTKIVKNQIGKFKIGSESKLTFKDDEEFEEYDAIVIATPLTKDTSSIRFFNFSESFEFPGSYERIICTLVQADLNLTTFKYKETGVLVEEILTDNASLIYNSVGRQFPVYKNPCKYDSPKVYKVFSPDILSEEMLSELFYNITEVEVIDWLAYPHYSSNEVLGRFELAPGLYYNNAIEKAASAMEMSVVAAKNSALLVENYIKGDKVNESNKDEL